MSSANLWLYFVLVSGVVLLPGMDMAFVMGCSLSGGRRAGFAAVAGIVVGGLCHMILAATGMSVLLKLIPGALTLMLVLGASYLAWIGWSIFRAGSFAGPAPSKGSSQALPSFFGAIGTCLLNPKAYIFMLAVFPQFVHAESGSIWLQAGILSVITAAIQIAIYGGIAYMATRAQNAFATGASVNIWTVRGVGILLMLTALMSLYAGLLDAV